MNPAPSSRPPARRPALPAFIGGGRPPRHTLVSITSLRGLQRLLLLSLLGQLVTIVLVAVALSRGELRPPNLADLVHGAVLRGVRP